MQHLTGELKVFNCSRHNKGIYCTVCVLFGRSEVRGSKLGRLVEQPLQNYAHLTGCDSYLTNIKKNFHQHNLLKTTEFIKRMQSNNNVSTLINPEF